MDPISALSVAAAVVAFVDFGAKVAYTAFEVRDSITGQPTEVVRLAASSRHLSSLASTARDKVKGLGLSYPRQAESFEHLAAECANAEKKLKDTLNKLTVNPTSKMTKAGSRFVVAVRSVWNEKDFEEWGRQLDRIRDQIMMNVLMCVWDEAKKTSNRTEHILQTVRRIETAMEAMEEDFKGIGAGRRLSENAGQTKMNAAIWASTGLIDVTTDSTAAPPPYTPLPTTEAPEDPGARIRLPFSQRLLRSLESGEMNDRASRIKSAFPNTFKWLFGNDGGDLKDGKEKPELSFRRWLSSKEETVFWITGQPASGKSTLMKFITTHSSLSQQLREWAGEDEVHVAKFYFWNPGSKAQKSRVGLLRSLLHQLLSRNRELSEAVAPRRRLFFDIAGDQAEAPEWDWTELRECLFRLASQLKSKNIRLALFIDGLDEYEGFVQERPETHQLTDEMVSFLVDLQSKFGAKLCVSSRPLNYFRDKFRDCPSLTMQQLTQPDIDLYVDQRLLSSRAIQDARKIEPEIIDKLISDLKTKARGVFLWVVLVIEQLLLTAEDDPHSSAILRVFNSLPDDLNKLYDTIQNQISPEKQRHASKLYQLVMEWKRTWNGQMEAIFLWLADEEDPTSQDYPGQVKKYPEPEKHKVIAEQTMRVVEGCTRGILQVSDAASSSGPRTIDFLHKTTYDWLREVSNWERILENGPPGYQPIIPILAVLVSHAQSLPHSKNHSVLKQCVSRIFMLASEVPDSPEARAKLVAILDGLSVQHLQALGRNSIFLQTAVRTENRTCDLNTITWAAAWACHPYICGRLERNPSSVLTPPSQGFSFLQKKGRPPHISVLETAMFGYRRHGSRTGPGDERWFNDVRKLNAWQASQRLETIKLLLEKGAKIEGYMKEALRAAVKDAPKDSTEAEYANLLLGLAGWRGILGRFDERRRKSFPDSKVWEAHDDWQFPEYKIDS